MDRKLLIYNNGVRVIEENHTFVTPTSELPVKEIDLSKLSLIDFELLKKHLENDVVVKQILHKIDQLISIKK